MCDRNEQDKQSASSRLEKIDARLTTPEEDIDTLKSRAEKEVHNIDKIEKFQSESSLPKS